MGRFRMNMFAVACDFKEDYGGLLKCEEAEVQCQYNQYRGMASTCYTANFRSFKPLNGFSPTEQK